jgi:pyruvate,water dikinase
MKDWVINLGSALPASLVGRKAAALALLIEAGFPVPGSVCITTAAFNVAKTQETGDLCQPDGMLETLSNMFSMNTPLAVRSSAVQEDSPEVSFAGRYATHLNVVGAAALERAILDCWRSYLSETLAAGDDGGMAVLVQPLLDAKCAGVCFTVDPVRLRSDQLLMVSGWGLGAGVVSGFAPTDTIRLRRRDLQVEDLSIGNKHTALVPATTGGVMPVSIPSDRSNIPCLPDSWLRRIGEYGLAIEQVFGAPQDIEWAVAGGQVWILQSRPITALPLETREAVRYPIVWENVEEQRHYWWLEQARDSAGTPLLPAELDFVRINTRGGQDAIYFGGGTHTRWRKEVNGRVYMTVAQAPHSSGHARVYHAALQNIFERLKQQDLTVWETLGPEVIGATNQMASFDAREADGDLLANHLEDVVATATLHWMLHTIGTGRPIQDTDLLNAYARIKGVQPESVASEIPFLLTGIETVQTRLVESLYDLACLAQEFPEEAKAIVLNTGDRQSTSPNAEPFIQALGCLIAEYGHRLCYQKIPDYPIELPFPWREAPEHVWEMISAYLPLARQGGTTPREIRIQAKNASDQQIELLCATAIQTGTDPDLVKDFLKKLAYARRNAVSLDEHNHYIDQLSEGQFMQALLYAGRWLVASGDLPVPFDVYWLNTDEVLAALRGSLEGLDLILTARRAEFTKWQALLPPPCLGLPTPELPERPEHPIDLGDPSPAPVNLHTHTLTGEPASRGSASGRARISAGDRLPADITPGDILVAPFASPALIPLLPAVAAVVLDYGGPGDHFAITAREFGLPAVCGTLHATRLIPEGAQLSVDAVSGHIRWI